VTLASGHARCIAPHLRLVPAICDRLGLADREVELTIEATLALGNGVLLFAFFAFVAVLVIYALYYLIFRLGK
jgi:hypothetical protein